MVDHIDQVLELSRLGIALVAIGYRPSEVASCVIVHTVVAGQVL